MSEISTLITDYVLAAVTVFFGLRLLRAARSNVARLLWGWAFIALALAAFIGGTFHGFQPLLPESLQFWMWKAVVYLIGVFAVAAASAAVVAAMKRGKRVALLAVIIFAALIYASFMVTREDFIYVNLFNAAGMATVLAIHLYTRLRWRDPASPWMIAGILVSGLAAAVQAMGVSLHRHFNNNDLFHVIQLFGVYLLFRGAAQLRDRYVPTESAPRI